MIELNRIYNEECLRGMEQIPDHSIDIKDSLPSQARSPLSKINIVKQINNIEKHTGILSQYTFLMQR